MGHGDGKAHQLVLVVDGKCHQVFVQHGHVLLDITVNLVLRQLGVLVQRGEGLVEHVEHLAPALGHLGEDGKEILPNRKKGIPAKPEQPVSSEPDCACSVLTVGTSALLEHVAQETGLSSILRRVFPADWRAMLTCAYFLASEGKALCHAEKWSQRNRVPLDAPLSSQRISELLPRIRPGMQQDFFRLWSAAVRCDEYYAMDITSISSYSEAIPFVRYGYNRDGEKLPQVNLLMLTGERSHLPIGYRVMPGSIKDVNALKESLARMELV